jgi:hypothetical protein
MSALGQKQTFAVQHVMSALPPIATAKADSRKLSAQLRMSAMGQKRIPPFILADVSTYSMISSARPINDDGTVMPSALAVLRLMISSTLVAC